MAQAISCYLQAVLCMASGLMCALTAAFFVTMKRYGLCALATVWAVWCITYSITLLLKI